ncbi:MAG: hypothetical protein ACW981_12960 [Candidatus Hodarchaeales archaeon]|jgi:bifunctional UDP-N-acetylglucosamine pyrophosphorylase/glucosamine-1-phosphate N-acetyltransferase
MKSTLCLFTYPESLDPFTNYTPEISVGGRTLFEHVIKTSSDLESNQIFIFDKKNLSNKDSKKFSSKKTRIQQITSLNSLKKHLNSDLLIFSGETIFSSAAVNKINQKIGKNPDLIHLFGNSSSLDEPQVNSIYFEKNIKKEYPQIKISKNLNNSKNFPDILAIYIPKQDLYPLVSIFVENLLFTEDETIDIQLKNNYDYTELDTTSFVKLNFPWNIINANKLLLSDFKAQINGEVEEGVKINGKLILESGARILQGSYINGPVYIAKGSTIGPNCFLRGNTFIGENVHIGQSVEIKNSVIMANTNIGHLSYIGDSIIGPENNFGAGSKTANLAFHNQSIKMNILGKRVNSGKRKLGIITGKSVKTGINSSLMPGIKLNNKSIVGAHVLLQDDLPEQTIIAFNKKNELISKKHDFF